MAGERELLNAVARNRVVQVQRILAANPDVNIYYQDGQGRTILYVAMYLDYSDIVTLLLQHAKPIHESVIFAPIDTPSVVKCGALYIESFQDIFTELTTDNRQWSILINNIEAAVQHCSQAGKPIYIDLYLEDDSYISLRGIENRVKNILGENSITMAIVQYMNGIEPNAEFKNNHGNYQQSFCFSLEDFLLKCINQDVKHLAMGGIYMASGVWAAAVRAGRDIVAAELSEDDDVNARKLARNSLISNTKVNFDLKGFFFERVSILSNLTEAIIGKDNDSYQPQYYLFPAHTNMYSLLPAGIKMSVKCDTANNGDLMKYSTELTSALASINWHEMEEKSATSSDASAITYYQFYKDGINPGGVLPIEYAPEVITPDGEFITSSTSLYNCLVEYQDDKLPKVNKRIAEQLLNEDRVDLTNERKSELQLAIRCGLHDIANLIKNKMPDIAQPKKKRKMHHDEKMSAVYAELSDDHHSSDADNEDEEISEMEIQQSVGSSSSSSSSNNHNKRKREQG